MKGEAPNGIAFSASQSAVTTRVGEKECAHYARIIRVGFV